MKTKICEYLSTVIPAISAADLSDMLEIPPEETMGDLALPCFGMAKKLRKAPAVIAGEMKHFLEDKKSELGIEKVECAGAYCNIFLSREIYAGKILTAIGKPNNGVAQTGTGKTICIDYSSPNIAKNFHVGHLRTTIIGNSLYHIYKKLGYYVVRINHLGDWGTQFGELIVAYKLWSSPEQVEKDGIAELLRIYVKFHTEVKQDESLMQQARVWFVKMEQEDPEALAIWNRFKEISMTEFGRIYSMLDITFDSYVGESFYRSKVPALVQLLSEKGILEESQGAEVIDLSAYDMPPCLIIKSGGGSTYHSRDIAAVLYRMEQYHFEKCLYVTGLEQTLHFKQIFKAIEVMGYEFADDLVHVPYGLVSFAGEKLSTRNGNIIYAEDILKEAIERAALAIEEKNPELADKAEVAKMVGVGAIIFHDLFNQRIKNVDFSWQDVLNFDGTTGPYVQYTYVRAKSILRKYGQPDRNEKIDYHLLTDDAAYHLIKTLAGYEECIRSAAEKYEPSMIARYVISLSSAFNKFYHDCSILQAEEAVKKARILLVDLVQQVLRDACGLLGMKSPEAM